MRQDTSRKFPTIYDFWDALDIRDFTAEPRPKPKPTPSILERYSLSTRFSYDLLTGDTFCVVRAGARGHVLASTSAFCHPDDRGSRRNYSHGRKIALGRALKALGLGYDDRKLMWDGYLDAERRGAFGPNLGGFAGLN